MENIIMNGVDPNSIIQTFVSSPYKSKACFYRIVYYNTQVKFSKRRANYGYFITNKELDPKKVSYSLMNCVTLENKDTCDIYPLRNH